MRNLKILVSIYLLTNLASKTLTSTSGGLLVRAEDNDDCCLKYSITASEDGQMSRWPLINPGGRCSGGTKRTFQEWIDYTCDHYGWSLCFEGWKYVVKGIYFNEIVWP